MDAGETFCDVCDFFEVVDPFWNEAASTGEGIPGGANFDGPAMHLESILG
jgi:hypothetical protein